MYSYCLHDVKKRMMDFIVADGSTSCPSVIARLCEMIKICQENDEPVAALHACGIVFEDMQFYIQRASLACSLMVPEKILVRRLDQAGMVLSTESVTGSDLNRNGRHDWEIRSYSLSTDCKRLRELLGQTGSYTGSKRRPLTEPNIITEPVRIGYTGSVRVPKKIMSTGHLVCTRQTTDIPVVFTDGARSEYMIFKKNLPINTERLPRIDVLKSVLAERVQSSK